ncbi:hypothetical protein WN51_11821 [Melipona quadrifasciata]|uniref:Uncharacterized protein n=1 Tax=Melipona quadrifasciata TaxID=166423 RepID=A0A0M9A461_9HYME|nr:hypothetical protein WN51_11821 [Melipona quadrifasciata]
MDDHNSHRKNGTLRNLSTGAWVAVDENHSQMKIAFDKWFGRDMHNDVAQNLADTSSDGELCTESQIKYAKFAKNENTILSEIKVRIYSKTSTSVYRVHHRSNEETLIQVDVGSAVGVQWIESNLPAVRSLEDHVLVEQARIPRQSHLKDPETEIIPNYTLMRHKSSLSSI